MRCGNVDARGRRRGTAGQWIKLGAAVAARQRRKGVLLGAAEHVREAQLQGKPGTGGSHDPQGHEGDIIPEVQSLM